MPSDGLRLGGGAASAIGDFDHGRVLRGRKGRMNLSSYPLSARGAGASEMSTRKSLKAIVRPEQAEP